MRGADRQTAATFSYVGSEGRVPRSHPLRAIRPPMNVPASAVFGALGTATDGASTYNLLFRWFVGLSKDAPVCDVTVFTKNYPRAIQF